MSMTYSLVFHDVVPSVDPTSLPVTTNWEALAGRRVLALLDIENLYYGARDRGRRPDYERLLAGLANASRSCRVHAFYSYANDGEQVSRSFRRLGLQPHGRRITHDRGGRRANCDGLLLFYAGFLARSSRCDTVLVGTGDGDLGCQVAEAVRQLVRPRRVLTLSIAGSTSRRLEASSNPHIAANLHLGQDVLVARESASESTYGI